jgi:predicted small lipoprotein YifL
MKQSHLILAVLIVAGLLTACGKRGELEAPKGAPSQPSDQPIILDKVL